MLKRDKAMKSNIVLIGMPGVGKSTIGVILAKILAYHFLDSDLVIQEREGKRLHEIISEVGTDGFLKIENDAQIGKKNKNTAKGDITAVNKFIEFKTGKKNSL